MNSILFFFFFFGPGERFIPTPLPLKVRHSRNTANSSQAWHYAEKNNISIFGLAIHNIRADKIGIIIIPHGVVVKKNEILIDGRNFINMWTSLVYTRGKNYVS